MKAFVVLAVLVAVASAGHLGGIAIANTGSSVSSRADDGWGNYKFGYDEQHHTGGSSRSEVGTHGGVVGSYTLNDADGRKRIVNYVADAHGFRANIKTNEPGTAPAPAAATSIAAPIAAQKHIGVVGHAAVAAPLAIGHGVGLGLGLGHGGLGLGLGHGAVLGGYGGHGLGAAYSTSIGHVAGVHGGYGHY